MLNLQIACGNEPHVLRTS